MTHGVSIQGLAAAALLGLTGVGAVRIGGLFEGYGGLTMAVREVLGGEVAWVSENDAEASRILEHHWPDVPNHGDITAIDWAAVEPVDVLTGGFPCQDISSSGRKAGIDDGEKSGLWTHMARAIGGVRPSLVVVENVRDLLARGFGRVLGDLADLGYDAAWTCLPACAAGAPFRRDRLFIVATPASTHGDGQRRLKEPHSSARPARKEGIAGQHPHRLALADDRLLDRWANVIGRPAPIPGEHEPGRNGQPRLNPAFSEWLMGLPAGHVTDPSIGISRNAQLKALGNGVVPQQAALALRMLGVGRLDSDAVAWPEPVSA